ncbi:tyrosine-type recombinase/integrase [Streptomyces mirabilis]|uniref:tyrosine-type recombinase/integrase n=1 Tax=Streptomyces mirabilis TaxID=68239 RepID=UPI0036895FAF
MQLGHQVRQLCGRHRGVGAAAADLPGQLRVVLRGPALAEDQEGDHVDTHFMDGSWRPACAKAGIPKGTGPHALRHHYASLLIKHGESVKTVSERLGHTNAAMTLNIYTHLWPDSEERTRAAVDKAYADQSADAQPRVDGAA